MNYYKLVLALDGFQPVFWSVVGNAFKFNTGTRDPRLAEMLQARVLDRRNF